MDELSIRYVVEQRCENPKHQGKLGAIPVLHSSPREAEQFLMLDVDKCEKCTFHSKFYTPEQCTLIKLSNKPPKKSNATEITLGVYFIIFIIASIALYNADKTYLMNKNYLAFLSLFSVAISLAPNVLNKDATSTSKLIGVFGFIAAFFAFWVGFKTIS